MRIAVGKPVIEGKVEMRVSYFEEIDGLVSSAEVTVWVPHSDSVSELESLAKTEAEQFLLRAVSHRSS